MNKSQYIDNDSFHCLLEACWIQIRDEDYQIGLEHFDFLYWVVVSLMVTFGLPLNLLIIHFEILGGDPQKRSLTNRLSTKALIFAVMASLSQQLFLGTLR